MDLNTKASSAASSSSSTTVTTTFPSTRHHHRKPISSDRFLGIPSHPQHFHSSEPELTEHDIFCSSPDFSSTSSSTYPTPSPSPSTSVIPHSHNNHHGILAVLSGGDDSEIHSVFNHKASSTSVSSPSTSSLLSSPSSTPSASRLIIPKRPPQPRPRTPHQSAPVNVPVLSKAMRRSRTARGLELDDVTDEAGLELDDVTEEEKTDAILPPHEIIDAKQSPILSCSVMEGAGRTLKGRDLRQVRNAVWRTTGFLD